VRRAASQSLIMGKNGMQLACTAALVLAASIASAADVPPSWADPMKQVHSRFHGEKGTLAQLGDSITVTMAFWAPLAGQPKGMDESTAQALRTVKAHIKGECWSKWKGPQFGNDGSMTIRWGHQHIDEWLKKLNPEVATIMFGSNDVDQMEAGEYERTTREVVHRCLQNGTIVILTTAPPRSSRFEKSREFADCIRRIAADEKLPLIDYFHEILKRRPIDWDGSLPQFKSSPGDEYQVPTLIARDGVHPSNPSKWFNDLSEEGLKHNGYALRNALTLAAYAEVIKQELLN
jgi:hypothetical protein